MIQEYVQTHGRNNAETRNGSWYPEQLPGRWILKRMIESGKLQEEGKPPRGLFMSCLKSNVRPSIEDLSDSIEI